MKYRGIRMYHLVLRNNTFVSGNGTKRQLLKCFYALDVTAPRDFFGFRYKRGSLKTRKFVRLSALTFLGAP